MTDIVVSLLTMTYNRLELSKMYIPRFIESVGDIAFEVLIWDNASNDGSCDWVYEYGLREHKVYKTFLADKNTGMEAFNTMAQEARGKYIIKVDDDLLLPFHFADRLVQAFEHVNEPKLLFLGWDMCWPSRNGTTFGTRSGMTLYQGNNGKIVKVDKQDSVFINYHPDKWLVNGVCRLSTKKQFLDIGGHPKGIIYGVDDPMCKRAAEHGYWIGYLNSDDVVYHKGLNDDKAYRSMKDIELQRAARAS